MDRKPILDAITVMKNQEQEMAKSIVLEKGQCWADRNGIRRTFQCFFNDGSVSYFLSDGNKNLELSEATASSFIENYAITLIKTVDIDEITAELC